MTYNEMGDRQKEEVNRRIARMRQTLEEQGKGSVRLAESGDKLEFLDSCGELLFTSPISEFVTPE